MSEKVLGKALKALGVPRNEFVVSTKCGRYVEGFDFSADRVTRSIDESLARLQLDYVDILQCHDIEFGNLDQVLSYLLFHYFIYAAIFVFVSLIVGLHSVVFLVFMVMFSKLMLCDGEAWLLCVFMCFPLYLVNRL